MDRLEVDVTAAAAGIRDAGFLLDVREPSEYSDGHAPNAVLMPLGSLAQRSTELPRDRRIYVICRSGNRSLHAAQALVQSGFDAVSVAGGMNAWASSGHPVITGGRAA